MKNTINLPETNITSVYGPDGDLALALALHTNPNSIIADADGNVFFADFAANRIAMDQTIAINAVLLN